jgi:SAM-dependent methyltransferase/acyl carrier protein
MQEWLTCTVQRIEALHPGKVLEIGCGKGLLLQHIAPKAAVYVGTDISSAVLGQLARWTSQRDDLKHVKLLQRSATDLRDLPAGFFDTVILNSVVQYFPDIGYLVGVLRGLAELIRPGGKIFIGDVRHLGLLPVFHSAVQLSRASATLSLAQLYRRVTRAVTQDKELVIAPEFFELLPGRIKGIADVDVQLRRGRATNELTRYRYDVVVEVREQPLERVHCEPLQWGSAVSSIVELEVALQERRWHAIRLTSIPNSRLSREAAARQIIETSAAHMEAGALRRELSALRSEEMDPDYFWELAERTGYEVRVTWGSGDTPGDFDVHLWAKERPDHQTHIRRKLSYTEVNWSDYANDPLETRFRQQLIPQLRDYLKGRLPEYMIPSAWMILSQLPLTSHGKLDRRALPAPEGRAEEMGEYIAPSTEVERALGNMWSQLLRVDQIGVQDNFFDLGGHSLLGMKLITKVTEQFSVTLPVSAVFKYPTIEQMAKFIESVQLVKGDSHAAKEGEFESGVL